MMMQQDIGSLDPELLQLSDVSMQLPSSKPNSWSKMRMEELFSSWLSLPETQRLVHSLLEDAKSGVTTGSTGNSNPSMSASLLSSLFLSGSTPPLSPRSASGSPRSPRSPMRRSSLGLSILGSPLKKASEPVKEMIPQFYFPNGPPVPTDLSDKGLVKIEELFSGYSYGLPLTAFAPIVREVCKLPSFFTTTVFKRIDTSNTGLVSRDMFSKYWFQNKMLTEDLPTRIFAILKHPDRKYLCQEDFWPILRELLLTHRGLEFLQDTPEFQDRYAETVIYRIFYHVNRSGNTSISLRELKRSNLVTALQQVDEEDDINKVLKYFSYEHFYIIYWKFWELDTDHDFLIDMDDLLRYGNHALTYRIVERIFSQVPRKFKSQERGKMGYEDFVWFILSEEDKTSEASLEYWFKCIDLDSNGVISSDEMQFFYEEQLHRMECLGQEPVLFEDILCQMVDMIGPEKPGMFTLRDLKRCKLAGNFFNVLFNLNKFIAFETRDPVAICQERENPHLTDWDRFAHREYIRLSMEDDGDDASNGSAEVWDESIEASF